MAVNCWVTPTAILGLAGVTAMEDKVPEGTVPEVTVRVAVATIPPSTALMVAVPDATPVAKPLLLTVATEGADELQVTKPVISPLGPTANVPLAVNCWVDPMDMVALLGATVMAVGIAIPLSVPHPFNDKGKDPRNSINKKNRNFFKKISFTETLSVEGSQSNFNHLLSNAKSYNAHSYF